MGATGEAVNESKLAADLAALFDRLKTLDPQVVVMADADGMPAAASLAVDEEQVGNGWFLFCLVHTHAASSLSMCACF